MARASARQAGPRQRRVGRGEFRFTVRSAEARRKGGERDVKLAKTNTYCWEVGWSGSLRDNPGIPTSSLGKPRYPKIREGSKKLVHLPVKGYPLVHQGQVFSWDKGTDQDGSGDTGWQSVGGEKREGKGGRNDKGKKTKKGL